jgi:hypothetical protein
LKVGKVKNLKGLESEERYGGELDFSCVFLLISQSLKVRNSFKVIVKGEFVFYG